MPKFGKTHFEQVPLELVKQIAIENPLDTDMSSDETAELPVVSTVERNSAGKASEWRKVAEAIVAEKDSKKLVELAEELTRLLELRATTMSPQAPATTTTQVRTCR